MRNINKNNITTEINFAFGLNNNHSQKDSSLKFFAEASAREIISLGDLGMFNNVNLVLHQSYNEYASNPKKSNNYVDDIWSNACSGCKGLYVCFDIPCGNFKMPCIDLCPVECPEDCEINDCEEMSPCDRLLEGSSANVRLGQVYSDELSTHNSVETDKLNIKNRCHYDGAQVRMKNGNYTAKIGYGKEGSAQGMDHLDEKQRDILDLEIKINLGKYGKAKIGHFDHDESDKTKDKSATYFTYDICFNKFKLRSAYVDAKKAGEDEQYSVSLSTELNGYETEATFYRKGKKDNWAITASKELDSDTIGFIHYDSEKEEIDMGAKGGFLLSLEGADACEPCIE